MMKSRNYILIIFIIILIVTLNTCLGKSDKSIVIKNYNKKPYATVELTASIPLEYRVEETESTISWIKNYQIVKKEGKYPEDFIAYIHIGSKNDDFMLLKEETKKLVSITTENEYNSRINDNKNEIIFSKIFNNFKYNTYYIEYKFEEYHISELYISNDKINDDDYAYVLVYFNKIDKIDINYLKEMLKSIELNID